MIRHCYNCHEQFNSPYRGWYEKYVPWACSGDCFKMAILKTLPKFNPLREEDEALPVYRVSKKVSDRSYRSSYECEFSEWLRKKKIEFEYEPFAFVLRDGERYIPDFLLYERLFVEVKGLWTGRGKRKFTNLVKQYYGIPIVVVDRAFLDMLKQEKK